MIEYYEYFILGAINMMQGSYRVLNSWKNLDICPAIFQTWEKSGK